MILPIYIYGSQVLRNVSQDIAPDYPDLNTFISDMWDTLYESDGIGLAAPQVGRDVRIVVIDLNEISDRYPEYKDFRQVFINGHIIEFGDETESSEEGCLSLPGIHENVVRPTRIRVKYCDEQFAEHDEWIGGYLARVIQHEFDHLEGVVFADRISPLRKQLVRGKLKALTQGRVKCGYRYKLK
ncbi:MAG: peptide deformylase [Prevotella sp.]|nr:peptide deformylase [Prevotella sp.]